MFVISVISGMAAVMIAWAHQPVAGSGVVAIDPVLGRIAFADLPASAPLVSFHYGFYHLRSAAVNMNAAILPYRSRRYKL